MISREALLGNVIEFNLTRLTGNWNRTNFKTSMINQIRILSLTS